MAERIEHTEAAEMEAFLAKPLSAQLLEIWLNGRETNGHVARALRDIREVERTLDETAHLVEGHLEEHAADEAMLKFIKRWGYRGTVILAALIALTGSDALVQIVEVMRHLWR